MDIEVQLVVGFVIDLVLTEGNIAHRHIVKIPPVGGFKSRHCDIRFGIKLFGNTSADGVQFRTVQPAVFHFLRQHPEEVAYTAGWL